MTLLGASPNPPQTKNELARNTQPCLQTVAVWGVTRVSHAMRTEDNTREVAKLTIALEDGVKRVFLKQYFCHRLLDCGEVIHRLCDYQIRILKIHLPWDDSITETFQDITLCFEFIYVGNARHQAVLNYQGQIHA